MMLFVIIFSTFITSSLQARPDNVEPDLSNGEEMDGNVEETPGTEERTFKISKKGLAYLIAGLALKALVFIKVALAKLTVLGNMSIILSKLSLLLSVLLAFGKYFGGISKMLKLKPVGYEAQQYGYYPGVPNHGNYLT